MVSGANIEQQRSPQRDRKAQRMEERHDPEHRITRPRMNDLLNRLDIRRDIVVRQHHAFRHAGRTGREDDGRHVIAANFVQPEHAVQDPRRHDKRAERSEQLVAAEHLSAQVFQNHKLGVETVFELLHQPGSQ